LPEFGVCIRVQFPHLKGQGTNDMVLKISYDIVLLN
jgi:hypothetical protein